MNNVRDDVVAHSGRFYTYTLTHTHTLTVQRLSRRDDDITLRHAYVNSALRAPLHMGWFSLCAIVFGFNCHGSTAAAGAAAAVHDKSSGAHLSAHLPAAAARKRGERLLVLAGST